MKSLNTLINIKDTRSLKLYIADKTIKCAMPITVCGFRAAESGARL
jgi:hypothetical protein